MNQTKEIVVHDDLADYTYCYHILTFEPEEKQNEENEKTVSTSQESEICKKNISKYYLELEKYKEGREDRLNQLNEIIKYKNIPKSESELLKKRLRLNESNSLRIRRSRTKLGDFKIISSLAKGGFGEVFLVIKEDTEEILCLKRIMKNSLTQRNNRQNVYDSLSKVNKEKNAMIKSQAIENNWITQLHYSFQDNDYFYFAMDYHCGGDFDSLLTNLGYLSTKVARKYAAEMVCCVACLHNLNFVHRDLKPKNFVVDKNGHLKLIDFGLTEEGKNMCFHLGKKTKHLLETYKDLSELSSGSYESHSSFEYRSSSLSSSKSKLAGSPEYLSPEILEGKSPNYKDDIWSFGCILCEMVIGFVPFSGSTIQEVFYKIRNYKDVVSVDIGAAKDLIDSDAFDLICNILVEADVRLDLQQIQSHKFFQGILWDLVAEMEAPFVPLITSDLDTTYFETSINLTTEDVSRLFPITPDSQQRRQLKGFSYKFKQPSINNMENWVESNSPKKSRKNSKGKSKIKYLNPNMSLQIESQTQTGKSMRREDAPLIASDTFRTKEARSTFLALMFGILISLIMAILSESIFTSVVSNKSMKDYYVITPTENFTSSFLGAVVSFSVFESYRYLITKLKVLRMRTSWKNQLIKLIFVILGVLISTIIKISEEPNTMWTILWLNTISPVTCSLGYLLAEISLLFNCL